MTKVGGYESMDALRSWHDECMAAEANHLTSNSDVIRAVDPDILDQEQINERVNQHLSASRISEGFCSECRYLLEHWPGLKGEWGYHCVVRYFQVDHIAAASSLGCRYCLFLMSRLEETGLLDRYQKIEARFRALQCDHQASIMTWDWGDSKNAQILWLNLPGKVAHGTNSPGPMETKFQSIAVSPSVKHNVWEHNFNRVSIARDWMDKCVKSHTACGPLKSHEPPTRLLSIASDDKIRIELTRNLASNPKYAALSYYWGSKPFAKLTQDNLGSLLENIPLEHLPRLFKTAIGIARGLGLAYLWIDALCIIQNEEDHRDWLHESAIMRSIYGGAYVNLAASSARGVDDDVSAAVPKYHSGGFCARVTTNELSAIHNFSNTDAWERATSRSHLATRAWTVQERLLAPRTIHFDDKEWFWECPSSVASEFLPHGLDTVSRKRLVCPENMPLPWEEIVQTYSGANMTFASDKLPAFSGIAKRQHEATGYQYVAGMWKERLIYEITWSVDIRYRKKRPAWRAPTWSWASVDGRCDVRDWYWGPEESKKNWRIQEPEYELARVTDAWTTLVGTDVYGPVTDGQISLHCSGMVWGRLGRPLEGGKVEVNGDKEETVMLGSSSQPFNIRLDCVEDDLFRGDDLLFLLPIYAGPSGRGVGIPKVWNAAKRKDRIMPPDNAAEQGESVYIGYNVFEVRGLVLQRLQDLPGEFRRVGSFRYDDNPRPWFDIEENQDHKYDKFFEVVKKAEHHTPEYLQKVDQVPMDNPKLRFTISIR